jgi:hypothetical protein
VDENLDEQPAEEKEALAVDSIIEENNTPAVRDS